jgi:hypothetical protein
VSYALDLEAEIPEENMHAPEQLISVRLAKGVAVITHDPRRKREYLAKNSGDRAKRILIEQPIDAAWELAAPEKAAEKTRNLYCFAVQTVPGEPVGLTVEENGSRGRKWPSATLASGSPCFTAPAPLATA